MVEFMERGGAAIRELEGRAAVLTDEQVEAIVKTQRSMLALGNIIKVTVGGLVAELAPSVEFLVDQIVDFYNANKKIIDLEIKAYAYDFAFALGFLWGLVKDVTKAILNFVSGHELLTRRALELIAVLGSSVAVLFVFKKAWDVLNIVLGPTMAILGGVWRGVGLLVDGLGALSKVVKVVTSAEWAWNAAIAFTELPLWAIVAVIGAVTIAIHDLWTLFRGGSLKDTWIGEFISWVGHFEAVANSVALLKGAFSKAGTAISEAIPLPSLAPVGTALTNLGAITGIGGPAAVAPSPASVGPANVTSNVDSNVVFNIPKTVEPREMQSAVQTAMENHLARVHREAQRSLRPGLSY